MPKYKCPYPECTYETDEAEGQLAATLLSIHSAGAHNHTQVGGDSQIQPAKAKVEKVRRPTVSAAGSSEEWSYFETRWADYVEATKITGKDKVIQLLECCDEPLRKDLTRHAGGTLTNKSVEEVMAAIKRLAVREENTMVARVQLHNMRQDRDETIRSFGARLRGQAGICKFTIKCPNCENDVNYTENILRDVVTRGVTDSDIQLDLLSDKNQNMTLEEVFQFIEAKEAGKQSAGHLIDSQGLDAARSSYRRAKSADTKLPRRQDHMNEQCTYCGKQGHGKAASPRIRKNECPAYGKKCDACGRLNHFENVCRSKDKPKLNITSKQDAENTIFDALCTTSNYGKHTHTIALDHHIYNELNDCWIKQPSKPQPYITLTAACHPEDYTDLGFKPTTTRSKEIEVSAMAETGCQSCLASMKIIERR